jgi:hypothetical protein
MPSSVEVDLVKRLRARSTIGFQGQSWADLKYPDKDCAEAADRIEALERLASEFLFRATAAEAALGEAREALEPFAEIGSWMFARPQVPDSEPVVTVHGINGSGWQLTRGMFKRAHLAATPTTAGQGDEK